MYAGTTAITAESGKAMDMPSATGWIRRKSWNAAGKDIAWVSAPLSFRAVRIRP